MPKKAQRELEARKDSEKWTNDERSAETGRKDCRMRGEICLCDVVFALEEDGDVKEHRDDDESAEGEEREADFPVQVQHAADGAEEGHQGGAEDADVLEVESVCAPVDRIVHYSAFHVYRLFFAPKS